MTVKELRDILNKEIENGHGKYNIMVVSSDCEPFRESETKFTKDIEPFIDESDSTFMITD